MFDFEQDVLIAGRKKIFLNEEVLDYERNYHARDFLSEKFSD